MSLKWHEQKHIQGVQKEQKYWFKGLLNELLCLLGLLFEPEDGDSMVLQQKINFYQSTLHHIPGDTLFIVISVRTSNPTYLPTLCQLRRQHTVKWEENYESVMQLQPLSMYNPSYLPRMTEERSKMASSWIKVYRNLFAVARSPVVVT
jgi:hypothetical protein